jgi:2,4'-dihydroxyacetophenone dioxygenase
VNEASGVEAAMTAADRLKYQRPQPSGMVPDLLLAGAMALDGDETLWIPQSAGVSFKPLLFGVSAGYYLNLLRVRSSGVLSRHRHNGPVHAITLRGQWRYLEHEWVSSAGDYAFEPPGETHTLVVPEHVSEMITLFHVTGGYVYVDPYGKATGYEDVFTKLERAQSHLRSVGQDPATLDRLIR